MSQSAAEAFKGLRFRGGRYDVPGYPLDSTSELARYERLVFDVARSLWKRQNTDRQRLPAGFKDSMQLRIVGVEPGSVIPVLERPRVAQRKATRQVADEGFAGLFAQSTGLIERTFAAVADGDSFPEELPSDLITEFLPFGSTLRDNESIEFTIRNPLAPVVYNQQVRKRFLSRTSVGRFSIERVVVGRVTSLDAARQEFVLADTRGTQLNGRFENSGLVSDFHAVLERPALAPVVRVEGTLSVTAADEVKEIEDVRSVELFELPQAPWSARLLELAELRRGWFDGEGDPVSFTALDFARESLREIGERGLAAPGIFPMPNGGVQLEWKVDDHVVSLDIDPDAVCHSFILKLSTDVDQELDVTSPADAVDSVAGALGE